MLLKNTKRTIMILVITIFILVSYVNVLKAEDFYAMGTRILEYGDQGSDVAILQQRLKDLNFYNGKVDGIYGKMTENAVRKLQQTYGLKVDGKAGDSTYRFLPNNIPIDFCLIIIYTVG